MLGKGIQQILVEYNPLLFENIYGLGFLYILCTLISILIIFIELFINAFQRFLNNNDSILLFICLSLN